MSKEKIKSLFIKLENTLFSEEEVIATLIHIYGKNMDNIDLLNDINEVFYERGYNCHFLMPSVKHKKFDVDEYCSYASKFVTKSSDKTMKLMDYLKEINSHRVTNMTLHLIKIKYLVDANILDINNSYIKKCYDENLDLREALFRDYLSENKDIIDAIKAMKEDVLTRIGGYGDDYNKFSYYEFILDTEFMLYSINNYKFSNMIKLMFLMVEEDHLKRLGSQYSTKYEDVGKYLTMIDKKYIKWYIEKHDSHVNSYKHDGYVQFYRHLEVK